LELSLKVFVHRSRFFRNVFGVFDLFVISVDIIATVAVLAWPVNLALPVVLARLARILKVTRALRLLTAFPELDFMVKGMLYASKTIVWGVILLAMLLCVWGIFAVLFIHPIAKDLEREGFWVERGCERCADAFSSVPQATLTLCQQLIIGDGWSLVNTPLMEERPETSIYFIMVMVTTTLAALNLFLGVIVEKATEAKAVTLREEAEKKEQMYKDASRRLYTLCQELDTDDSGLLSLDELKAGYQDNADFADLLKTMDIDDRDLDVVFNMLDRDGSGAVEYQEFVEQLHMMRNHEPQTMLVFIKFYVMEIRRTVSQAMVPSLSRPTPRPRHSLVLGDAVGHGPSSRHSERSAVTAAPTNSEPWPDLERELRGLAELRREVLDFAQGQAQRLDRLQLRLGGARASGDDDEVRRRHTGALALAGADAPEEAKAQRGASQPGRPLREPSLNDPVVGQAPPTDLVAPAPGPMRRKELRTL